MVKIMIADDQQLIRESLKIILDSDPSFEVVKVVGSGQEVLDSLKTESVDIILMDVRMPSMSGVECTRLVKKKYPNIKVIILTTFDDDEYVFNALKYGASGYLLKGVSVPDLTAAIRTVVSGGAMINPGIVTKVVKFFNQMARQEIPVEVDESGVDELSKTERNIAHLVGRGRSNREIAEELRLSEGTVRNGLSSALSKLQLRDRTQLAIWAVQTGLAAEMAES